MCANKKKPGAGSIWQKRRQTSGVSEVRNRETWKSIKMS